MNSNNDKNKTEFTTFEKWLIGFAIGFGVLGLLAFIITILFFNTGEIYERTKPVDSGKFGDFGSFMSGSVGIVWSLVSVILFYLTLRLQRKELGFQREELEMTRNELLGQKNQMIKQNDTLNIQRFENTFFNLLNQHHQIVSDIDFRYYKSKEKEQKFVIRARSEAMSAPAAEKEIVEIKGRDVFRFRYNRMKEEMTEKPTEFKEIYQSHYEDAQTDFGHYFRNLYRMIKMVDEADFNDTENLSIDFETKYRYVSIIRAQISDYELSWLFYNCITPNGREKFKPLIEKYTILKNLPLKLILINHKNLYLEKAFNK